jgi:hypothetical protein
LYLARSAGPRKEFKEGCEKSGVRFRNLFLLVLCIWHDKGPGGGQGDREEAVVEIQVNEECLFNIVGAPAPC